MDKELDEIIASIKGEDTKVAPHTGQHTQVAETLSQTGTPKPASHGTVSPSERSSHEGVKQQKRKRPFRGWIIAVAIVVLLLLAITLLFFKGYLGGGDVLKGTWSLDGITVYQFEGNGKGAMVLPSKTYTFKYTINEEEKTVTIDFEDEKAKDNSYSYQVSAQKLFLSSSVGEENIVYEFTKTDR